ncbi:hypothetical protein CRG98_043147 [Punica granatum]|uniref:Uncharacterized protein n=1 Tax=Punica granatum TaxID=22663 RepID=A0A2I0HXW0_PUNGR|nr:hypothetical protein CRG98_043147 [Punica granatum]
MRAPKQTRLGSVHLPGDARRSHVRRSRLCALEFNLVGARMRAPKQTRLGSVHLPGDARRTHVRRSRHLPFYDPKVEGRQVTRVWGYGVHLNAKEMVIRNRTFRIRGFYYVQTYIPHALSVL